MDYLNCLKALSNKTRLNILLWLKDPKENFGELGWGPHPIEVDVDKYVCVGYIQKKAKQSQSTVSEHLSTLEKSGLIKAIKIKQWTLYARNEEVISELKNYISEEL